MKNLLATEWANAHKLWRARTALSWGAFYGALTAFTYAFSGVFDPWVFLGICAVGYAILAYGRFTHAKGLKDD